MIQHCVQVGPLSDSYMGLVYVSHISSLILSDGGLELGVNGTSYTGHAFLDDWCM